MKIILLLIFSIFSISVFAQQNVFKISAQKQILSVHLNEDNKNKKITIDTRGKIANVQRLSIRNLYPEADKDVVRTFQVVKANSENAIITFTDDKETGVFNLGLKDLADKLSPGTYHLYTIAVPKDAATASTVKAGRVLIATLEVI